MIEADDEHHVASFGRADEHVAEESDVFADIEERQSMFQSIVSDEQADLVRWLRLEIAMLDVKHLVEETADMESESVFLLL